VEGFLSVNQAAEKAKVATGSVYRWLDDPNVPLTRHKTANGRVRIREAELDAWLRMRDTPVVVSLQAASPVVSGAAS
jgi:excisionase family DNA binding protein